jgi:hypothetical protein
MQPIHPSVDAVNAEALNRRPVTLADVVPHGGGGLAWRPPCHCHAAKADCRVLHRALVCHYRLHRHVLALDAGGFSCWHAINWFQQRV